MARGFAPALYFVRSRYVVVCLLARSLGQGLRACPVAPALVPKAVSARGFLVPPLRSGHSSAPSGLFFRLAHQTADARERVGFRRSGVSGTSPDTPQPVACASNCGYVLLAPSSRPMGGARICGASCGRGPRPALVGSGGPPPLLAFPAPDGRAPPRWAGLWESGVPLRGAFLSADARAGGNGGGVSLGAPPCVRVPRPPAAPYRSRRAPVSARPRSRIVRD